MEVGTDNKDSFIGDTSISDILEQLQEEGEVERHLPGGGYLHMSEELPYLVVYRLKEDTDQDKATIRFVLSEASFLILGNKDFEAYRQLMFSLGDVMASKFKTFLLLELYAGPQGSNSFHLKGPATKLPTTIKVFKEELEKMTAKYQGLSFSETHIEDTEQRQLEGDLPLLEVEELKDAGILLLGLQIPPLYRTSEGEEYPVFFRSFKDDLVLVLHKTIFEFIRVQTSSGVESYRALGQKKLREKVLEIDKTLSRIETSYQFLWLISPSNIRQVKETFFKSNYEKILNYHYRLLPIDPDVLKRELYNLKVEEVDDPALSFLFREKREELEMQISMLTDRGTPHFFYNSLMLYDGIERNLQQQAKQLLSEVQEEDPLDPTEYQMDAEDFKTLAQEEFEYFKEQDGNFYSRIHVRDDVNILMVSQGELYIPSDYKMAPTETKALIQHEVGTHVLTYYNGIQHPLRMLSTGLTDYDALQEGIAVLAEYLVDGLTANRMRTLAGRVVAAAARLDGAEFQEIFRLLHHQYGFSDLRAFNTTSRIMQGGGFTKDVIYLRGLVQLREYLQSGGDLEELLSGKFALKHLPVIRELMERGVLKDTNILPRYLKSEQTQSRLQKIRDGISLSQMIRT